MPGLWLYRYGARQWFPWTQSKVPTKGIIHTHTLGVHTVGIGRLRIIVDAANESTAWSGSRFVPITEAGFPASDVQVSNLDTREDGR